MRVLVTPEWYPSPDRSYFGTFCREQARCVASIADVVVLTWRVDPGLRSPFHVEVTNDEGLLTYCVRFARARVPKAGFTFKITGCLKVLAGLARRGWTADIVHAHEYSAGPVARTLATIAGAPVIVSEHWSGFALDTLPVREGRRARRVFEHARFVCPVSRQLAVRLQSLAPRAAIKPVPNAVDTDVFAYGHRTPRAVPRLVTVGSLVDIKGHRDLILAVGALRRAGRPVTLELVGDGPLRGELERLARATGVGDGIVFRGAVSKTGVAVALREADMFVLPSLWENLPCVLLEAMATGLPVVATRVGGVPEIVEPGSGLMVSPRSPDTLAMGIAKMADALGDHDGARLRERIVSRFSYSAVAREWSALYDRACTVPRSADRASVTIG